jgi:hypothetical protein
MTSRDGARRSGCGDRDNKVARPSTSHSNQQDPHEGHTMSILTSLATSAINGIGPTTVCTPRLHSTNARG